MNFLSQLNKDACEKDGEKREMSNMAEANFITHNREYKKAYKDA